MAKSTIEAYHAQMRFDCPLCLTESIMIIIRIGSKRFSFLQANPQANIQRGDGFPRTWKCNCGHESPITVEKVRVFRRAFLHA